MISRQLLNQLNILINPSDELERLRKALGQLHLYESSLRSYSFKVAASDVNTSTLTNSFTSFRDKLSEYSKSINNWQKRATFQSIENLQQRLDSSDFGLDEIRIGQLKSLLSTFASSYEEYLSSYQPAETRQLLSTGNDLYLSLEAVLETASFVTHAVHPLVLDETEESTLDLVLESKITLIDFSKKIAALSVIYDELCVLFDVSASAHPLRIAKLEAGSLWAKLFGESRVIQLMVSLIERGVGFFHRNYTREGRTESIPRSVEAVESILGLRQKLKEAGISSPDLDENINKAANKVAANLSILLGDEPKVLINNAQHSVSADILQALELNGEKVLLEEYTDSDSDDSPILTLEPPPELGSAEDS